MRRLGAQVTGDHPRVSDENLQREGRQGHDVGLVLREVLNWGEVDGDVALEAQCDKDVMVSGVGRARHCTPRSVVRYGCCGWNCQRAVRSPCRVERRTRGLGWLRCRV